MKKITGTVFLVFILISGCSFLFPEIFQDMINSISPSYSWAIMGGIWIVTFLLTIVFIVMVATDKKSRKTNLPEA